jgi:phage gp29-like protein
MNEPTINRGVLTAEIATRDTAWDYVGMIGLLTDPDPVLFKLDSGAEVLNSIMADAHLTSVCQTRKHGTLNREWSIEPGTVNNEEPGADAVALAEQFAADLYNLDVDGLINQILDAVLFGYVPIELMWAPDGGRIKLTNARALPFRWFGFNEKNEPRYISTKNMIDGEPIPTGKFVFARHQASFDNPYGVRLLSRAFWPVTFKRGGLKWWVKFAEKFGSPFVLGRYQNKDQAAAMLTQLKNMVQDAVATIPDGCAVDTLQSNVTGSTDVFDRLKTAMDSEISKLVLGQTLTTEVGDKGTQALGTVHKSVLEAYQASDQRLVETTMNEIAWVYAQINAPTTAAPVFQWQEDSDLQGDRADRDKILSDTGQVSFTKDYIVREYGFEDGDIGPGHDDATTSNRKA